MLPAIDLDHEALFETHEIEDERADRVLPPEPVAIERTAPQPPPELGFGVCKVLSESAGAFVCHATSIPPTPALPLKGGGGKLAAGLLCATYAA